MVAGFFSVRVEGGVVRTLRFLLPVVDQSDLHAVLDVVTRVDGVMAALVDGGEPALEVVVASEASALLVKSEVLQALLTAPSALAVA